MWNYAQFTGWLSRDGGFEGSGYSGFGAGLNDPDSETIPNVGPIPRGKWRIIRWDDHHGDKGPIVGILEPVGHDAHGRSAFLIHGDNAAGDHSASHGCIILPRAVRVKMRDSGDTDLEVIA
jgi:hypothetical protein